MNQPLGTQSSKSPTVIIGVDPGTRFTGFGVIELRGNALVHLDSGRIAPPSDWPLPRRLAHIFEQLQAVLLCHDPQEAALESIFSSKNAQSALKLGHARGVAMLALQQFGAEISEYTAGQIKRAVVGGGRADKAQVQQMVRTLLGLPTLATEDASDALAAAICRSQQRTLAGALSALGPVSAGRSANSPAKRGGWRTLDAAGIARLTAKRNQQGANS